MSNQVRITNNKNLPEVIFLAAQNDTYISLGDISVTGLIESPRRRQYQLKYGHLITYDVEEMLASLEGTALHNILERADKWYEEAKSLENVVIYHRKRQKEYYDKAEQTTDERKKKKLLEIAFTFETAANFNFKVLRKNFPQYKENVINEAILMVNMYGWMIKGQVDRLIIVNNNGVAEIQDYKKKSVWAYNDQHERFVETAQLNIYALMVAQGIERFDPFIRNELEPPSNVRPNVKKLTIIRWYRDWNETQAVSKPANKYPPTKVVEFDLTLWDKKQTEQYIKERLALHTQAAKDPESVDCTPAEKWVSESDEFKVYAKDSAGGRAIRVFNNKEDAIAFAKEHEARKPVEVRHTTGKPKRCLKFCKFQPWCTQYVREYGEQGYMDGSYKVVYQTEE
jgi:hypothetical protein